MECSGCEFRFVTIFFFIRVLRTVICACGMDLNIVCLKLHWHRSSAPTSRRAAAKLFSHYDFSRLHWPEHLVLYANVANAARTQQEINHQAESLAKSNLLHIKLHKLSHTIQMKNSLTFICATKTSRRTKIMQLHIPTGRWELRDV